MVKTLEELDALISEMSDEITQLKTSLQKYHDELEYRMRGVTASLALVVSANAQGVASQLEEKVHDVENRILYKVQSMSMRRNADFSDLCIEDDE